MPRLRNTKSGAVISVRDEKVALMGAEWASVDSKAAPAKKAAATKKTPAKKASSSKSSK